MPNRQAIMGAWPVRHLSGGIIRANRYEIASALGNSIFTGDPVKTSPGTNKRIDVAAATNVFRGFFAGCEYVNAQGEQKFSRYWPGGTVLATGTTAYGYVYDDPNILFGIEASGNLTATMVGQLIDLVATQAGNTATGLSGFEADTANVGSSKQLTIVELLPQVGNAYGVSAKIGVLIDKHELLTRGTSPT